MYSTIPDYEIFKKLKSEGVLGGLWMFNRGSLLDFSGNGNHITAKVGLTLVDGGAVFRDGGCSAPYDSSYEYNGEVTIGLYSPGVKSQKDYEIPIAKRYGFDTDWQLVLNTSNCVFQNNTGSATYAGNMSGAKYLAVSEISGVAPKLYKDGNLEGSMSGTISLSDTGLPLYLGGINAGAGTNRNFESTAYAFFVATRSLTATEHSQLYAAFSEMERLERFPTQYKCLPSIDPNPSEDGLVLGCNMRPVGSVLPNLGTGDNGAITGARHGKDALGDFLYFDGVNDYVNFGSDLLDEVVDDFGFFAWVDHNDTDVALCTRRDAGGTHFQIYIDGPGMLAFYDGTSVRTFSTALSLDRAYAVAGWVSSGRAYLAVNGVTEDVGSVSLSNYTTDCMLGGRGGTSSYRLKGKMYAPKILTTLPSDPATYAKREYKKGLYALVQAGYGARESVATVSAGYVENTNIELLTGSVKIIGEFDADNNHLKIIEAQSASTIKFPLTNLGDEDENRWAWYDDGGGYEWTELSTTNRVLTLASGDKFIYSSLRGNSSMIKRLLA